MEVLSNVLLKEVKGPNDLVVYVDNLPKDLLYRRVKKMMIDPDQNQRMVPEYEVVNGKKIPTNAFTDELQPGIEMSQTGDGAYVFFTLMIESAQRLAIIDRYLKSTVPVAERIQERVPYAIQPGVMSSGTIPLHNIPRIVLPAPVSPPAQAVQEGTHTAALETPKKKTRRPMTEEQKESARKRMARAREVRTAQQTGKLA